LQQRRPSRFWPLWRLAGLLLGFAAMTSGNMRAQPILWQSAAGGDGVEDVGEMIVTTDGSLMIVGNTRSGVIHGTRRGPDSKVPRLDADMYMVKMSAQGRILWQKLYGEDYSEMAHAVALTPEGGYIMAGNTDSKSLTHGKRDFFIVRTDMLGNKLWQKTYGGDQNESAHAVISLEEGGYFVAGETASRQSGNVTANRGGKDAWLLRLNDKGDVIWERNFGGRVNDRFEAMVRADGASLMLVGATESESHDAVGNHGKMDVFVARVDMQGNKLWSKTLGGPENDEGYDLVKTPDGNFLLTGTTFSSSGDVSENNGRGDVWAVKFDHQGNILWEETYGGSLNEGANCVAATYQNNYLIGGTASSRDGDLEQYRGKYDGWVVKTDSAGNLLWQRTIGGSEKDEFYDVQEMPSGNYALVGESRSRDFDLASLSQNENSNFWTLGITDPQDQQRTQSLTPTTLIGYVRDAHTEDFVRAEVSLVDNSTGEELRSAHSDTTYGIYQLILPDTLRLSIGAFAPGYMFYTKEISLRERQRYAEIRHDIALKPIDTGETLKLFNIHFDSGEYNLRERSDVELRRLERFMRMNPNVHIRISGHTDSTGTRETKKKLSRLRAKQVKLHLYNHGIEKSRMETVGKGLTDPLVAETSAWARQRNRRVEITIIKR
jgi:outer membrane protein OmpA-like peptidoglycan-associated protein